VNTVRIERLIVEGGFLDGLDLSFSSGLNTLIGGRGTGKTSIIELLRFCLGVTNYTESSAKRSREHALAILQDGRVSVVCAFRGKSYTFVRTATTGAQKLDGAQLPIIFSQRDIEQLGMEAPGRLNLIDNFSDADFEISPPDEVVSTVASLTAQMQNIAREIDSLSSQLSEKPATELALKNTSSQEAALLQASNAAQTKQAELRKITDQTSAIAATAELARRVADTIQNFTKQLSSVTAAAPMLERWQNSMGPDDLLAPVRKDYLSAVAAVKSATETMLNASIRARKIEEGIREQRVPLDQAARQLREEIEGFQQGAGAVTRQTSLLREKLNQLASIESTRTDRTERLANLQEQRGRFLDELDAHAQKTFDLRAEIVNRLNASLAPKIRLRAIRAAQVESYAAAISNALRGSGIKYGEVSSEIAVRMSPRELVEIAERMDVDQLCTATEITKDRAFRIITRLREIGLESVLTSRVEDDVELSLLHGNQYKSIDRLSMGQRCTVVLPIIMEHRDRVIVVDQPEDHLDNEFVTETLIRSLRDRGKNSQIIFSTHNANIPVLGEADQVVYLGSDGQHGFVHHAGALDDDETVTAITNVMEGGREAFEKRASFYAQHQGGA
jgi:energy-coupling factor transporter ATP-binding protein EcfA2